MKEPLILRRNWWQRTFSKVQRGSVRSSVFALVSTALGAGSLALPHVVKNTGLILGVILLVLAALVALQGMNNISAAAEHYRIFDYAQLVSKVLGKPAAIFLECLLSLYLFISLVAYQIISYNSTEQAIVKLGFPAVQDYRLIIRTAIIVCVVLPLSLLKSLSGLRFLSILSMTSVLYLAILIAVQLPYYVPDNDYSSDLKLFEVNWGIIPSFCVCMFSFICHMNVASIYSEMQNPISRKMNKANMAAVGFELGVYLVIAVFGYLSTLEDTPGLFYERPLAKGFNQDYMMIVGQMLVSVVVSVGLICLTLPCRHNLTRLIRRLINLNTGSMLFHVLITTFIVAGTYLMSVLVPEVVVLLEFLGASSPIFCNLLPALLVASTEKHPCSGKNVLQVGVASCACLLGVFTVVLKVLNYQ